MQTVAEWLSNPLDVISSLYDGDQSKHAAKIAEYFGTKVADKNTLSSIPSLNSCPLHELKTNTLVRFRCMVQDMYDPEYYLGWYEVKDAKTGASRMLSGKYRDVIDRKPGEEILMESNKNVTLDRQTLYCIPVPGENVWVKEIYSNQSKPPQNASTSSGGQNRSKRSLDEDEDEEADSMEVAEVGDAQSESVEKGKMQKHADSEEEKGAGDASKGEGKSSSSSTGLDLNFPLSDEKGPACIVKIYEDQGFKVNDVVEFVGILSNDPFMASFPSDDKKSSMEDNLMEGFQDEDDARSPPPSLVPRLHVLHSKKLMHENPLINSEVSSQSTNPAEIERILNEACEIRSQLLDILTYALLGDSLSAEFLLCHLVSTVYSRQDVLALGKFSVNLLGCPRGKYTQYLYSVIEQLVTKSHFLSLTVKNLNEAVFTPTKDYNENRLKTGMLQLSDNTHLVLDETIMEAGHLDVAGVKNLTALGNIIKWQKLEYDFNFHRQDFPTNIAVLVLSEGKSLIQCDSLVRLTPKDVPEDITQHFANLGNKIVTELLAKVRSYLTIVRQLPYDLTDDIRQKVQEDFIEMRKEDPKNMTGDDFHDLLTLSRLLSLTFGKTSLSGEIWQKTKMMEKERKRRLDPPSATAPNA